MAAPVVAGAAVKAGAAAKAGTAAKAGAAAQGGSAGSFGGYLAGQLQQRLLAEAVGRLLSPRTWRRLLLLFLIFPLLLAMLVSVVAGGLLGGAGGGIGNALGLPAGARPFFPMYEDAASVYGVSPFLLMAVHEDESTFGQSNAPGVRQGVNFAGCCAGPMQFLIQGGATPRVGGRGGTWAGYSDAYRKAKLPRPASYPNRYEPHPNVYDSYDAIYAAAKKLHQNGAGPTLDRRSFKALVYYKGSPPHSVPFAERDYNRALQFQRVSQQAAPPGAIGLTPGGGLEASGPLAWPLDARHRNLTSGFGMRWGTLHAGIDLAAPAGTPIRAAAAGRVRKSGWGGGYGNLVVLDHGNGRSTYYAHQSQLGPTRVGGVIGRGGFVGRVGSTGHSTGNHLHFELRINGKPVDPLPCLRGRRGSC